MKQLARITGFAIVSCFATFSASGQITFTNPAPAIRGFFGRSVAALGNERMVIGSIGRDFGAVNAGAAYVFRADGLWLATLTNPAPKIADLFGWSLATVGMDQVIVGAPQNSEIATGNGLAYLISTNGARLMTFTNPFPAGSYSDGFGYSVAALGRERVVCGAIGASSGGVSAGAAYLFCTDGTLLVTLTNPSPTSGGAFGWSAATLGDDRILIGALRDDAGGVAAGAAYLFTTNGSLVTVFTNPSPANFDYFGYSVAGVGTDRVLIGAPRDAAGTNKPGVVYLYTTNGTLLTVLINPAPTDGDNFGWSMAVSPDHRIVIGAPGRDAGAPDSGVVYIFSTNGVLLNTLTNPTPATHDYFGYCLAPVSNDQVLVGAIYDDVGATDAGAAYLLGLEPSLPLLSIARNAQSTHVLWFTDEPGLILQQAGQLTSPNIWTDVSEPVITSGATNFVVQPLTNTNRFYRLRRH